MSQSPSLRINRGATFAQRRGGTAGLIGAVVIHLTLIGATLFTFAHKLDIVDESSPIVPVDLVTIGDKTNIAPTITKDTKIDADQDIQAPAPEVVSPTIAPPEDEVPDQAPSEPVVKKVEPMLQPQLKPKPAAAPQPEPKKQKFDINNIMAMLDKQGPKSSATNAKVANRANKGFGAQDAMTADLQTALQSQIYQCWNPPVGVPNAGQLVPIFDHLYLNRDGTVARPPQLSADSASAKASNPYMRAAVEAATRAILTCAPYKLPADKYAVWNDVSPLVFDPSKLAGQ